MPALSATVTAAAPRAPQQLGRFELRRVLGQGAQATVWLGYDPRLDREVAVKLMRPDAASADDQPAMAAQWLQEARSVSRLNHPHIVPVFEADVQNGQPYLVFEYVPGRTLSETLRTRRTPLPSREAVTMMLGILDALQVAHAAGVVHRDLKPSNILVDNLGRARVMDFGIAARVARGAAEPAGGHRIVGTPGYMSPEAACGEAPSPAMDVYAAGMMLAEMLCGRPLIIERDPFRAIHRAANEDMQLPESTPEDVDDRLRALLLRAFARDPAQRLPGAAAFRDSLAQWLAPAPSAPAEGAAGVLDFLLRRMRHKSDFPAMSASVATIQRLADSDRESLGSLAGEILKDVALTNKLLRMVNTAHYAQPGGGSVSTVSRAVALVGFAGIRNMAMSLVLLEHMQDKLHANHLKEEFLRSLMAGSLASQLCAQGQEGEEAFIGAMFQNLGRLLTQFYFPEEARQVEAAMAQAQDALGEESASIQALGMSYEELGLGVARSWGLPQSLQRCMQRPRGEPPSEEPSRAADRLRWVALAANEVATTLLRSEPSQVDRRIGAIAERYARVLGIGADEMLACTRLAQDRLAQMARAMGLGVLPDAPARRLLEAKASGRPAPVADDPLAQHALQATMPAAGSGAGVTGDAVTLVVVDREQAAAMMAAGIQDITNAMVESFKLNEVLRMILETILRALRLQRVVFCLRDPKTGDLGARFGLGVGIEALLPHFRVAMKGPPDLFSAVCLKGADTLIADASTPAVAARLPAWYRQHVDAPAFLLLPLAMKGAPFALIYADMARAGALDLGERELALLRTLRNQAVMAFRQAG